MSSLNRDQLLQRARSEVSEVSPQELHRQLEDGGGPTVIDVRERDEFVQGHLPGAVFIPVRVVPCLKGWIFRAGFKVGLANKVHFALFVRPVPLVTVTPLSVRFEFRHFFDGHQAQLFHPGDATFQGTHVEPFAFCQEPFPPDDVIFGKGVSFKFQFAHVSHFALGESQG